MWVEVKESRDKLALWNKELEKQVTKRTNDIRGLLNNAGQGFLYFSADLIVGNEYSSQCKDIFGGEIAGRIITNLICSDEEEKVILQENAK